MGVATTNSWPVPALRLGCESMFKARYPRTRTSATLLLLAVTCSLVLAACGPKKPLVSAVKPAVQQLAPAPQTSAEIQALMLQARGGDLSGALQALQQMVTTAPVPLAEEAAFRRVELMLENDMPDADAAAAQVLAQYPMDALVPYTHYWLSGWRLRQTGDVAGALDELDQVLRSPRLTRELLDKSLATGAPLAHSALEWDSVRWFFAAAAADPSRSEDWLRDAANRASLATIRRLRTEKLINASNAEIFYTTAARIRLMAGKMDEVAAIAGFLSQDAPGSAAYAEVQGWASGKTRPATIGVLLPLTGTYAQYGKDALRGIRLAYASLEYRQNVVLQIEDTASNPQDCVLAYRRLLSDGADIIIGPLLTKNAAALLPQLTGNMPVLSLSSLPGNANLRGKGLYINSLALRMQAQFLAEYAFTQGAMRMVIIQGDKPDEISEADSFADTFEAHGGTIVDRVTLPADGVDFRRVLLRMRRDTDDEQLLADLDRDMSLFIPEQDLEIRMPVRFDAVYLAMNGKHVALLAGQLAYVDINGLPIYGSSRWADGHLLDDRGRYLSSSRFVEIQFPNGDTPAMQDANAAYREAWGADNPPPLVGIAYDTLRIAAVVSSRLGLTGHAAVQGLQSPEGFPGLTGHVRFGPDGIGHKTLDLFTVQDGKAVPAS
jgi:ABC-type branched-subunit amino acid transport system substrate-binding protein